MKRLIPFILTCCYTLSSFADNYAVSDSLVRLLPTLPQDTTLLVALNNIIKIEQNNEKCIIYSDSLMKESLKQKNVKYACLSVYYHVLYYYNQTEQDSVAKWMKKMEPLAEKSGMWDYYFDAQRFQVDLYTFSEQYEKAIEEANQMKQKATERKNNRGLVAAHQCLSNAYIGSQRWDEGLKALEQAYNLLPKNGNPVVRISVLSQLITVTKEMKDNKKLLKYLQEQARTLNKYIHDNPSLKAGFSDVYIFNNIFYAHYYLDTKQPLLAYEHIVKSKKYLNKNTYFMYRVLYYDVYASYYKYQKNYDQATSYIDTTLNMLKNDFPSDYAEQLLDKARIWVEAGNYTKAMPLYKQALTIKDSAAIAISNNQLEQIKKSYNIDKIELKQDRETNEIRLLSLAIISVILIILFASFFRLFKVRKALRLSEKEIRKATDTVRSTNEMKNRFLSNMSYNIRTPLNNVVGFSQLIASEPNMDDRIREEYSEIIHQSSEKLMRLVNNVLDLSRLEAKMMKFQMQDYDAVVLCNEVFYMARMRNETTNIEIQYTSEIDSILIHTDTTRLGQALLSTLSYIEKPQEQLGKREISFKLSSKENRLYLQITNSPLADQALSSQESSIRNEINSLLLTHFGGSYKINQQGAQGAEIILCYPLPAESE